jgi:arylsulfatase
VAIRYDDWKAVFLANRGRQLGVWQEPFIELRIPYLFNLRRDPFEKAFENSNTYWDWYIDRAWTLYPLAPIVGQFLKTFEEFPPRQKAGSFTVSNALETIETATRK